MIVPIGIITPVLNILTLASGLLKKRTASKKLKIKNRIKLHTIFGLIVTILVLSHTYPILFPSEIVTQDDIMLINETSIKLPDPNLEGEMSLEETLLKRRSIREYSDKEISLQYLSQLLWSAQGITNAQGGRTSPSAGATYPLELYVQVRRVEKLEPGIYHYNPQENSLSLTKPGNLSDDLMKAGLNQQWIRDASFNIIVTAEFSRTTDRYGTRGIQYVYLEAGHAAQNIYLQVTSIELGCVVIGAFNNDLVENVIGTQEYEPIYIIPVGVPR